MTGDLEINGYDAYVKWGVSMEDGSLTQLMAYPSVKEWITNETRLGNGTIYIPPALGASFATTTQWRAARELTIVLHMTAKTKEQFLLNHGNFEAEVLATGNVNIRTKHQITTMYRCKYISCTQFAQYHDENGGIAKFALKLVEPNPVDRTLDQGFSQTIPHYQS